MKKNRIFIIWIFIACLVLLPSSRVCAEEAGRTRVLVALGDSYTSGEGLEPYFGQDAPMEEKCMNPDWLAHRSEGSWPGMLTLPGVEGTLAEHRSENFFFAAASGAMTRHLFLLTEEEKANGQSAEFEKPYSRDGISGVALLAPQLSVFDELDARGLKADYVVMTISGNDVDFRGIVMMSLFGQTRRLEGETDVDKGVSLLEQQYETGNVRENIRRVFYDTAFRAGEQAVLLVVGYPCPLVDENAVSIFSSESARIMNEANDFFCMELIRLVDECRNEGMNICYVGVSHAFRGHGAYADDAYINPIVLMAGKQDLDASALVGSASLHPNQKGAEAYARCVQYAIDQLEAGTDRYIFDYFAADD